MPELSDQPVLIVDTPVQIVEALVLQPGGNRKRNNDRQSDLNEWLLQDVDGCRIHVQYSSASVSHRIRILTDPEIPITDRENIFTR